MFSKNKWKKFLLNLKNGNCTAIYRALIYFFFFYLGIVLVLPTVLVLWVLKPFFWVKVGKLHHVRIGHLALETDIILRRRQLKIIPDSPFYCFLCDSRGVANRQLLTMFKRVMRIYESRILVALFDGMFPLFKNTPFHQPLGLNNNEYFEYENGKVSIFFTPEEIKKGRELLKRMSVDFEKDDYICVFSRDSTFLEHLVPSSKGRIQYEVRNSDIDTYIDAIKFLIKCGYTVIRVGSMVTKPVAWSHPKLVDYSISEHQCDFLDIFLLVTCKFFIGDSSGISTIPVIADVPSLYTNMPEFGIVPIGKRCLYIPKNRRLIKSARYLRFKEALDLKLDTHMRNAHKIGLEVEDNSPQDILEATKEMHARVKGEFYYSPEEDKLMKEFQKLWSQSDILSKNVPTPIGIEWLKKNKEIFFQNDPATRL